MAGDSQPGTDVQTASNLFDWFHERVRDARGSLAPALSEESTLYLTTLLVERARADHVTLPERTLVELHARATQAPPAEQLRTYRELGDRSLHLVGYFEESLQRKTVGTDYYCTMGAAAYSRVDDVFKRWFANAFDDIFQELAEHFRTCVRVLREVRKSVDDEPDVLMRLYRQWIETGSEEAALRLRSRGLVIPLRTET
jgi:hypothetical protein